MKFSFSSDYISSSSNLREENEMKVFQLFFFFFHPKKHVENRSLNRDQISIKNFKIGLILILSNFAQNNKQNLKNILRS